MSQTAAIIAFRSSFLNRDLNPFAKAMLKLFSIADKACNYSRQTLHGVIAFTGLSIFSSIAVITLIIVARIRSDVSNDSLLMASLALLRASLNLYFLHQITILLSLTHRSRSVVSWRVCWRGILIWLELRIRIDSLLRLIPLLHSPLAPSHLLGSPPPCDGVVCMSQ